MIDYWKGTREYLNDNYEEADKYIGTLVKKTTLYPPMNFTCAGIWNSLGLHNEANELYSLVYDQNPVFLSVLDEIITELYKGGKYKEIIDLAPGYLSHSKAFRDYYVSSDYTIIVIELYYIRSLLKLDLLQEAQAHVNENRKLYFELNDERLFVLEGIIELKLGNISEAEFYLHKALKTEPLGLSILDEEDSLIIRQADHQDMKCPALAFSQLYLLGNKDDFGLLQEFSEKVESIPDGHIFYNVFAIYLHLAGKYHKALDYYLKFLNKSYCKSAVESACQILYHIDNIEGILKLGDQWPNEITALQRLYYSLDEENDAPLRSKLAYEIIRRNGNKFYNWIDIFGSLQNDPNELVKELIKYSKFYNYDYQAYLTCGQHFFNNGEHVAAKDQLLRLYDVKSFNETFPMLFAANELILNER